MASNSEAPTETPEWALSIDASAALAPLTDEDYVRPTLLRRPEKSKMTLTITHRGSPVLVAEMNELVVTSTTKYANPGDALAAFVEAANRPTPEREEPPGSTSGGTREPGGDLST